MLEPDVPSTGDAKVTARRFLDLVNSSWMTQAIYVAARLGVADQLATGAKRSEALARATGADPAALGRLMRALTAIEICRVREDEAFELTPMGSLLRTDAVDSLRSWTLHWGGSLWPIWGHLLHSVMTGRSARKEVTGSEGFDSLETDPEAAAIFHLAMVELTRLDSIDIARCCKFSGTQRVVDVGGGYGELLAKILEANPAVSGVLFDRPHAIERGRAHLEAAGVADRCEFVGGDFFDSVPVGGDVYLLKSVIHDWDDERSKAILRNCRGAMREGARLQLVERIVPQPLGTSAADRAVVRGDLNMLVGLGGMERTEAEYRALLDATGLRLQEVLPAGSVFSIIEATRQS